MLDKQSPQLIEPPRRRRRQVVAVIVIVIVIIGFAISFLVQPFGSPDSQQGNVFGGLGWIAQIIVSFILILASIVQLTGYSIRDLFSSRIAKTNVEDFPFYVYQEYDKFLDYLFPDPKAPLISDRKIKYLPQISFETDAALQQKGMVLIRGRSKTGKTREACELLRRWWYSGPTVLVARSHVGLYPPFKIPENLPVRNLVLVFDDIDRYLGDAAALKKIDETLQFFQSICRDRGEIRVIATVRQEEEFWGKLNFDQMQPPWNKFELIQLNPLSPEKAQEVIIELSKMSEITIEPSLVKTLAEKNDGTFLNLALAFRSWMSQNIQNVTLVNISAFEGALKTTWRKRYEELATSHPNIKPIYAAIDFMQSHNLPLRPALINELATEMGLSKGSLFLLGLFDRLQNWFDMSPMFNWYRDPKRRQKGWLTISLAGLVAMYLLLFSFLRFAPGSTQFWFFDGLSEKLTFQIFCLLPLWILLIPFAFYSAMNILRNLVFRRMSKALDLLLATEVPLRGSDLRPYENQFEGHGNTRNWGLQNYSGEIRDSKFISTALQRLNNRYIFLAEQFRLNGEFSAAYKLATLAQQLSSNHPAPIFMLGKININEGNFQNAIELLNTNQALYQRSSNVAHFQERIALSYLLLGDYETAEKFSDQALKEMPSLINARWVLGLAQLKQEKISIGQKNCKLAAASNQSIPTEIKRVMEIVEVGDVSVKFNIPTSKPKLQKWRKTFGSGSAYLISIIVISVMFITFVPYFNTLTEQAESGLPLSNALLTIFPNSPFLLFLRSGAYNVLGEYEKAIADDNEAIRLDPKFAIAYYHRGYAYQSLGEYEKAIADDTEAIRLDPKFAIPYNDRGYAYQSLSEYEKAIADYNEAIRLDPKYAIAYSNRGSAYHLLSEYEKAIADYTEAIRLDPKLAIAHNNRGIAYQELGEYEKAIADHTEAIRLDPKYANAYSFRGIAYQAMGRHAEADADFQKYNELTGQP